MKLDGTADARDLVKVLGKANKLFDNGEHSRWWYC